MMLASLAHLDGLSLLPQDFTAAESPLTSMAPACVCLDVHWGIDVIDGYGSRGTYVTSKYK